jgi:ubiquinone/menaquinone biosynthesis C-methylase UbiE
MPRAKEMYDLVTAFETVYYWSSLELGLKEIFRVLKPGGTCVIANEMDGLDPEHKKLEKCIAMLVYSIEDISDILAKVGFTNIKQRHDEERHFICVTAKKP